MIVVRLASWEEEFKIDHYAYTTDIKLFETISYHFKLLWIKRLNHNFPHTSISCMILFYFSFLNNYLFILSV